MKLPKPLEVTKSIAGILFVIEVSDMMLKDAMRGRTSNRPANHSDAPPKKMLRWLCKL